MEKEQKEEEKKTDLFIEAFKINDKSFEIKNNDSEIEKKENILTGFKKINIFVGANNSSKSRFMRLILKDKDYIFVKGKLDNYKKLSKLYNKIILSKPEFKNKYSMVNLENILNEKPRYVSKSDYIQLLEKIKIKSLQFSTGNGSDLGVAQEINSKLREYNVDLDIEDVKRKKFVYIPIIRGLRTFEKLCVNKDNINNNIYKEKTTEDYNIESFHSDIFTGLDFYSEIKEITGGNNKQRNIKKNFEKFLSEEFFQNKKLEITASNDGILSISLDNRDDKKIHDLGDGIQSIIISVFQAFKYQDDGVILFIEEPENTLHPSMQRVLIETFVRKFPKLQVFLTTHSNHFLDLAYDYKDNVSIYSFEKKENDKIEEEKFEIKNISDNSKILDLLGIRKSSVFLSNSVIWVEGVTDRMFLSALLKLDKDRFGNYMEDKHYAFAEYGGSNIVNYDFLNEENNDNLVKVKEIFGKNNFLVADNDGEFIKKKKRKKEKD